MSGTPDGLFNDAPCGYAVCDPIGRVLEANAELLRLTGRDRDEVVGQSLPNLVSAGGRIYFDTHIFPLLALQGSVHEVALELVHADGTRVPVLLNANVARAADGTVETIRVVVLEARDRRRYESDLLAAVRATEEARRAADELAFTLQQTLIPPTPPTIAGLDVAVAYRPAGDGSEVGGDFFDVFQVAEHEWVVVIGDVLGKGVAAATVTAFVRHTVRDLAMQVTDPAVLLARLDHALTAHATDKFCTLVVVRLLCRDSGWEVTGSVGGHPPPLVRSPDGTVTALGQAGSLVGALEGAVYHRFSRPLDDDVLVLYTDGVVEARRDRELYGDERLVELVTATEGDVHVLTQAIVDDVLRYQDGDAYDDIAVVTLRQRPD